MQIVFDESVLEYQKTRGNPQRLVIAHEFLQKKYDFVKPELKVKEPIVHSKEMIEAIKSEDKSKFNPDSPVVEGIYDWAMLSLNSAIKAQEIQGFSFMEPPGHHSYKNRFGGFCYFNNIAEAVERSGLKTLIIDIDGHHGDGTEDIFTGNKDVFFISLHRKHIYPFSGNVSDRNILNCPLPYDCGSEVYFNTLEKAIQKSKRVFDAKQVAVSAGFDTYQGDLASLGLKEGDYYKIGVIIKELIGEKKVRRFAVLEGGYNSKLGELIHEFISGFG